MYTDEKIFIFFSRGYGQAVERPYPLDTQSPLLWHPEQVSGPQLLVSRHIIDVDERRQRGAGDLPVSLLQSTFTADNIDQLLPIHFRLRLL